MTIEHVFEDTVLEIYRSGVAPYVIACRFDLSSQVISRAITAAEERERRR